MAHQWFHAPSWQSCLKLQGSRFAHTFAVQGLTRLDTWQILTRLDKAWQVESDSEWQKSTVKALNLLGVHSERKSFSREKSTQRPNSTRNSHVTVWELVKKGPAMKMRMKMRMKHNERWILANFGLWAAKMCRVLHFLSLLFRLVFFSKTHSRLATVAWLNLQDNNAVARW